MNLYKRTAAGNTAALDAKSPLPRKLRTLLISVDGRTRQSTYVKTLSSFGDVAALLDALMQQGYIELIAADSDTATVKTSRSDWQATDSPITERLDPANSAPHALDSAFKLAGLRNTDILSDDVSSWDRFQPQPLATGTTAPTAMRAGAPPSSAQHQLRSAISLMSDCVSTHLPADALEIVLTLEGLDSVEQVIASLKGYQAMIAPTGSAATRHLEALRELLSRR